MSNQSNIATTSYITNFAVKKAKITKDILDKKSLLLV